MISTILIISNEEQACWALEQAISQEEYSSKKTHKGIEGIKLIQKDSPALVALGFNLPDMESIEVLKQIKKIQPEIPVIIVTSNNTIEDVITAMKLGAFDYITPPFNKNRIINTIKQNISHAGNVNFLQPNLSLKYNNFVGQSRAMQEIKQLIEQVARSNANILISGESGTGKEIAAITIHQNSARKGGPFVPVNCAALPEQLMESELFGHEKGAFTGAVSRKPGRFEMADRGTIFLDEIAEMPLNMQAKLLRVLQEKSFLRVGGIETLSADVRIIAATNRQLNQAIKNGNFREDLYYRLNVVQIHIPPLRDRPEDIPDLAKYFVKKFKPSYGVEKISDDAISILTQYDWPGNIRELQNIIERAAIVCKNNTINPEHLPSNIKQNNTIKNKNNSVNNIILSFPDQGLSLEELEKELLIKALEKTGGNQTKAAKLLGITRSAFLYRSQKYGICYN